jgi:hypothetical protein
MEDESRTHTEGEQSDAGSAGDKADLGKRFVAAAIDGGIGIVIGLIPAVGGLAAAAYWAVRDGMEFEFMHHRSVGKHLMKLRPVTLDGSPMDITASVRRNWMFALGGIVELLWWIPFIGWLFSVRRNWMFALGGIVELLWWIPFIGWLFVIPVALAAFAIGVLELYLVITDPEGRRLGDKIANTMVIEVED